MRAWVSFIVVALYLLAPNVRAERVNCNFAEKLEDITPSNDVRDSPIVKAFQKKYQFFRSITKTDNANYIQLAEKDTGDHLFLTAELGNLQELNNYILKDKRLVDAVANLKKQLLYDRIHSDPEIAAHLLAVGEDSPAEYTGFKDIIFAFKKGNHSDALQKRLVALSQSVAEDFKTEIEKLNLHSLYEHEVGNSQTPLTWHRLGIGETTAEAHGAAKFADHLNHNLLENQPVKVGIFTEAETSIQKEILNLRKIEEKLMNNPDLLKQGVLVETQTKGRSMLSVDVMSKLKKSKSKEEFGKIASQVFKLKKPLTETEINHIYDWYQTADAYFSPQILEAERVSVHSVESEFGVVSVDYANLTARKIQTAMEGLAATADARPKTALKNIHYFFEKDHARLLQQHRRIHALAEQAFGKVKIYFSGDDLVLVPEKKLSVLEMKKFTTSVQADSEANQIRTVFTTLTPIQRRGYSIFQAEMLEKNIRKQLEDKIELKVLNSLNLGIQRVELKNGEYALRLMVAGQATADEQKIIQAVVQKLDSDGARLKSIKFYAPK